MKIIPLECIPLGHCFFIFISNRRRFFKFRFFVLSDRRKMVPMSQCTNKTYILVMPVNVSP